MGDKTKNDLPALERRVEELKYDGYEIVKVLCDCNNLFRCFSVFYDKKEDHYKFYREACADYIEKNAEEFAVKFATDDSLVRWTEDGGKDTASRMTNENDLIDAMASDMGGVVELELTSRNIGNHESQQSGDFNGRAGALDGNVAFAAAAEGTIAIDSEMNGIYFEEYAKTLRNMSIVDKVFTGKVEMHALQQRYRINVEILTVDGDTKSLVFDRHSTQTIHLLETKAFYILLIPPAKSQSKPTQDGKGRGCCSCLNFSALSWRFALFFGCGLMCGVWFVIYFFSPSTAYLWAVIMAVVESAFGIYHFSALLKLKEQVDKIHRENLKYKVNNVRLRKQVNELEGEVNRLADIRVDLENDKDALSRAYHTYSGFNEKFNQLLQGKEQRLATLQKSANGIIDRWTKSVIKHEKGILGKLWAYFEGWENEDGMDVLEPKEKLSKRAYDELVDSLPRAMKRPMIERTFEKLGEDFDFIDYDEFRDIVNQVTKDAIAQAKELPEVMDS